MAGRKKNNGLGPTPDDGRRRSGPFGTSWPTHAEQHARKSAVKSGYTTNGGRVRTLCSPAARPAPGSVAPAALREEFLTARLIEQGRSAGVLPLTGLPSGTCE